MDLKPRSSKALNPLRVCAGKPHAIIVPMKTVGLQVNTIRQSAGLFEHFPRGLVQVRGADRHSFLHNLLTHDIKGLHPGQGKPACLLDRQGKIQFAATVHAAENELLLELDPHDVDSALEKLKKFLVSEDAQLNDVTHLYDAALCVGPDAPRLLAEAFPDVSLPESHFTHTPWKTETHVKWIVRWDGLGIPGFYLWMEKGAAVKPAGLSLMEPETFDLIRIEAGLPWPGSEITHTTLFNELGDDEMVSYTKGCYVGQEIVARIKYRAHPPRKLTGFLVDGSEIPSQGSAILQEGKSVGEVTSSCFSPTLGKIIALGFLSYGVSDERLTLQLPGGRASAKTHPLPFVAPSGSSSPPPSYKTA